MTLVNLDEYPSAHAEHIAHVLEQHAEAARETATAQQERLISDFNEGKVKQPEAAKRARQTLNLWQDAQLSDELAASIRMRIG